MKFVYNNNHRIVEIYDKDSIEIRAIFTDFKTVVQMFLISVVLNTKYIFYVFFYVQPSLIVVFVVMSYRKRRSVYRNFEKRLGAFVYVNHNIYGLFVLIFL